MYCFVYDHFYIASSLDGYANVPTKRFGTKSIGSSKIKLFQNFEGDP